MSELTAAETRHTYVGTKAATYDLEREHESKWTREHAAVTAFLAGATGRVLDIPVGTGRFLMLYRSLGLTVVGRDVSEAMMAQARAKDPDADIARGDILNIDLPDRSVETAVCVRLLNLISQSEMQTAVRELCRVTSERLILSIRTGPRQSRQNRSNTHTTAAFEAAYRGGGFAVRQHTVCGKAGYGVALLTR